MQRLERAKELVNDRRRRQATTTKAQLGGLLILAGIANVFHVELGDDLQARDSDEKTTTILKFLWALLPIVQRGACHDEKSRVWIELGIHRLTEKEHLSLTQTPSTFISRSNTRTVIQLGGLLWKSTLPKACGIAMGDDLQSTYQQLTKAALLLGCLVDEHIFINKEHDIKA